jgi:hypothetical protein
MLSSAREQATLESFPENSREVTGESAYTSASWAFFGDTMIILSFRTVTRPGGAVPGFSDVADLRVVDGQGVGVAGLAPVSREARRFLDGGLSGADFSSETAYESLFIQTGNASRVALTTPAPAALERSRGKRLL